MATEELSVGRAYGLYDCESGIGHCPHEYAGESFVSEEDCVCSPNQRRFVHTVGYVYAPIHAHFSVCLLWFSGRSGLSRCARNRDTTEWHLRLCLWLRKGGIHPRHYDRPSNCRRSATSRPDHIRSLCATCQRRTRCSRRIFYLSNGIFPYRDRDILLHPRCFPLPLYHPPTLPV